MNTLTAFPDFPVPLFIDLAIGTSSFEDCCWANGHDPAAVLPWEKNPEFEHRMAIARRAVDDDGRAFQARCRTVVQDNVTQMEGIIKDGETTASHRIDAFKTLAKLGNLEPQETPGPGPGGGLSLTIIAPGGEQILINQTAQAPALAGMSIPVPVEKVIEPAEFEPLPELDVEGLMWIESPT